MSACQLTADIVDSGIKIKECLKKLNYGEEARDRFKFCVNVKN